MLTEVLYSTFMVHSTLGLEPESGLIQNSSPVTTGQVSLVEAKAEREKWA